jgi:type II restriction/modification system DNA methylase subunit YeeA
MLKKPMTPQEFIAKWQASEVKESAAAQEHFIDLCHLLEHPTPIEFDPQGNSFTFEKGLSKTGGGQGFADVWKKGCFGWEYKGKHKDLNKALAQLQQYAIALENPPLLIVSDMDTIRVHTNFTNTVQEVHVLSLQDLLDPAKLQILHYAFFNPEALKPSRTRAAVTEAVAQEFAELARRLRERGHEAQRVAHFINRLLFCMFAEDSGLFDGEKLLTEILEVCRTRPKFCAAAWKNLFAAMRDGGLFGMQVLKHFNGGLFADDDVLPLENEDIRLLIKAAKQDWQDIEPSIFGTLFERGLDPDKRSQLGAHYTPPEDILRIIEPVVLQPLRREWESVKAQIKELLEQKKNAKKNKQDAMNFFNQFLQRLGDVKVLDPACGSGNFLYLALRGLKDLEHLANIEAENLGLSRQLALNTGPKNLLGIEVNPYAAELARVTVWIGQLQWLLKHPGYDLAEPLLQPLNQIECRDAVFNETDGTEPEWPAVDYIVGNPPFLGDKKMISVLGEEYVNSLRVLYQGRVPGGADLVTYWFEKARGQLDRGLAKAAGLVSTNSIRGGANRKVLERIKNTGRIFNAWSDEPWVNDGAAVRVSLICFEAAPTLFSMSSPGNSTNGKPPSEPADATASAPESTLAPTLQRGSVYAGAPAPSPSPDAPLERRGKHSHAGAWEREEHAALNGTAVNGIYADLTGIKENSVDLTQAKQLKENSGISFIGSQKNGPFDISGDLARQWLQLPANFNGRSNSDVLRPWANGMDVVQRPSDTWIIDFGVDMLEQQAAAYEKPFEYAIKQIKPKRVGKREVKATEKWWLHQRPRPELRQALAHLERYILTPRVSKHRVFIWMKKQVLPDSATVAIARDDDTTFGILHSRFHELWSLGLCTWLGKGNDPRYTPTTTFETFPFPEGLTPNIPAQNYADNEGAKRIAAAAKKLNEYRENWLNPPEWALKKAEVVAGYPDRIVPKDEHAAEELKKRTLTNLYNQRPSWLDFAHKALDAAVAEAYGWPADLSDEEILRRLLELNLQRSGSAARGR